MRHRPQPPIDSGGGRFNHPVQTEGGAMWKRIGGGFALAMWAGSALAGPFCVVTNFGTECNSFDYPSCQRAAAQARGACVVQPGNGASNPGLANITIDPNMGKIEPSPTHEGLHPTLLHGLRARLAMRGTWTFLVASGPPRRRTALVWSTLTASSAEHDAKMGRFGQLSRPSLFRPKLRGLNP
jgi:hypothetical protein